MKLTVPQYLLWSIEINSVNIIIVDIVHWKMSWPYNPIDITITRALKMPRVNVHTKFDGGSVNKVLVCSLGNNVPSYIWDCYAAKPLPVPLCQKGCLGRVGRPWPAKSGW